MILEMKNIRKRFDELEVLRDISFGVDSGEVVSIIGPSGSGKSTLLRCATFLETIDGGEIVYMGEKAAHTDAAGKAVYVHQHELRRFRRYCGLVFQQFNLFPQYTVLDNVTLAVKLREKNRPDYKKNKKQINAEIEEKAKALLGKLGLSDKLDYYPCQLSGGQQQRVSIARAMALEPKILFFDEPTSALDPELTGEVLKVIRELAEEHMTMVIVTHEMNFAREVSDYIIFLDQGVTAEEGRAEEVISNPKSQRLKEFLSKITD